MAEPEEHRESEGLPEWGSPSLRHSSTWEATPVQAAVVGTLRFALGDKQTALRLLAHKAMSPSLSVGAHWFRYSGSSVATPPEAQTCRCSYLEEGFGAPEWWLASKEEEAQPNLASKPVLFQWPTRLAVGLGLKESYPAALRRL